MVVNLPCLWGSCPNFLRPTCPYTECQLSFLTGSCPTETTPAGYSSCLSFRSTDRASLVTYRLMDASIITCMPVRFSLSMQYRYSISTAPSPGPCPITMRRRPGMTLELLIVLTDHCFLLMQLRSTQYSPDAGYLSASSPDRTVVRF